jgi:hypothetical protein
MAFKAPIGLSDFKTLRQVGGYYVDKSQLIVDLVESIASVTLFTRPRRFGKTLNLSMLRYFFEKSDEDRSALFSDLAMWGSDEARRHFRRYPVVALSFKEAKGGTLESVLALVRGVLADGLRPHRYLLDDGLLPDDEAETFDALLRGSASIEQYAGSIKQLCRQLAEHHGEHVVLLIDEYDTPIHSGHANGFYDEIVSFFRSLFTSGLKDNSFLHKGVLTGVLRVAKESLFSGVNNLEVHGALSSSLGVTAFGFTDPEVVAITQAMEQPERMEEIRHWYDGYRTFDGQSLFNPWSVLNYASKPQLGLRPYWVQTSSDDALRGAVLEHGHAIAAEVESLLAGGSVTKTIDENVVLKDLERRENAVWSLLLSSGYVTAESWQLDEYGMPLAELIIPNHELYTSWRASILSWLDYGAGGREKVRELWATMLDGNAEEFGDLLSELVIRTLSVHDVAGVMPERVYQAFLLGLLAEPPAGYRMHSNREAGFGRYDLSIVPAKAGRPGVVIELKRLGKRETPETALDAAMTQLAARRYSDELLAVGAAPIVQYGIVFDGKQVWIRKA